MKKGIIAAKQQDYVLATRYFQDARRIAPNAPEIYYNLGLAESKIPGRELRAIAWFGAYLAANPNAPNAGAIKDQIDVLGVKNQSNISHLIQSIQEAAGQTGAPWRPGALQNTAGLWAESGDVAAAFKVVELIPDTVSRSKAQIAIAKAQIEAGDNASAKKTLVSALKTADGIPEDLFNTRGLAQSDVAIAQTQAADIAEAKKTADLISIKDPLSKIRAQVAIANAQIKARDFAGANQTLSAAGKTSSLLVTDNGISYKEDIATAQLQIGDIADARQMLILARKLVDSLPNSPSENANRKARVFGSIFYLQAQAGDISGARETLRSAIRLIPLIKDGNDKKSTQQLVTKDYIGTLMGLVNKRIEAGDIAGAQEIADLIQDSQTRSYSEKNIAEAKARAKAGNTAGKAGDGQKAPAQAQAQTNSTNNPVSTATPAKPVEAPVVPVKASDYLENLDSQNSYSDCALNTPVFLDLAGYLKTLPTADNPQTAFNTLLVIAEKIIKAQNVIDGMLKQQTEQGKK